MIYLWDVAARRLKSELFARRGGFWTVVAFSADGQVLASKIQNDGKDPIQLWDVEQGKELRRFGGRNGRATLAFTSNGDLVEVWGSILTFFDPKTGKKVGEINSTKQIFHGLAFSRGGRMGVLGTLELNTKAQPITAWDIPSKTPIGGFPGHKSQINCLALSPSGNLLASGGWDGAVRIWDFHSGSELASLAGHQGGVLSLDFSPDEKLLASGGTDTSTLVWDLGRLPKTAGAVDLAKENADKLLADLLGEDGCKSYTAFWKCVRANKQSLALLKMRLPKLDLDDHASVRVVLVLEYIGTNAARELLRVLANETETEVGKQAEQALKRMKKT